jgi:glycosyltransferase involved in cell wall biosynthesis
MPPGADDRFHAMPAVFDPEWFYPDGEKDRRLVFRTGLASRTKDMPLFIQLAARCPRHRFVLAPCWSVGHPEVLDELQTLNRSLGDPVEILPNLPPIEVAGFVRRAGISLHTHGLMEPYGMPVSIVEAMATGAYVIARYAPAAASFIGPAGRTYETIDEAEALLKATEAWTDDDWRAARLRSVERAYSGHAAPEVLRPLWDEWARLAGRRALATSP